MAGPANDQRVARLRRGARVCGGSLLPHEDKTGACRRSGSHAPQSLTACSTVVMVSSALRWMMLPAWPSTIKDGDSSRA
jgi:hypothetical protein